MAKYSGSQGIEALRKKIKLKSETLMRETSLSILNFVVDTSPIGAPIYNSKSGAVYNDVGDYKNSWTLGIGVARPVVRDGDASGAYAIRDGNLTMRNYKLEDKIYITNATGHAKNVEFGWEANTEYGWKPKDGYHVVAQTTPTAIAIANAVAIKVGKM